MKEVIRNKNEERFQIRSSVTEVPDEPIEINAIPSERSTVTSTKYGSIKLKKRIGGGGEGDVYKTDIQYIAKIYKKEKLTLRTQKKLELMISKKISFSGICYPVDLLYDRKKNFIGFLMPDAKGDVLQTSVFQPMVLRDLHPDWTKIDLVELALTILKKISYLHNKNIILGDINPQNILVVSPTEVYFVDTDSYQIEDFPCPVGTVYFTPPELQGTEFKKYLRTFGNEDFAIATLLFMIMLVGKPPYAHVGGGSPGENVRDMRFPYPFKEFTEDTPPGFYRFCWSHLPFKLKEAFYKTFTKDEEYSKSDSRLTVDKWISLFLDYKRLLEKGILLEQDEMANDIFPTRLKRNRKYTYKECRLCSQEFPEHKLKQGICNDCLNKSYKGRQYFCKTCGSEIIYTNYQHYIKRFPKPLSKCRKCFEAENQVYKRIVCIDCGKTFDFTNREHDFFIQKGWDEPTRCKECRDKKKKKNE